MSARRGKPLKARIGTKAVNKEIAKEIPGDLEIPIFSRSQPSCEIKRDSKGNVSIAIKVYADTILEARELALENFLTLDEEV